MIKNMKKCSKINDYNFFTVRKSEDYAQYSQSNEIL
jgi:hypothetical protein